MCLCKYKDVHTSNICLCSASHYHWRNKMVTCWILRHNTSCNKHKKKESFYFSCAYACANFTSVHTVFLKKVLWSRMFALNIPLITLKWLVDWWYLFYWFSGFPTLQKLQFGFILSSYFLTFKIPSPSGMSLEWLYSWYYDQIFISWFFGCITENSMKEQKCHLPFGNICISFGDIKVWNICEICK